MERETGEPNIKDTTARIKAITGKFIAGDIIDMDFPKIKGIVPDTRRIMTPKEWEKRRKEILLKPLP